MNRIFLLIALLFFSVFSAQKISSNKWSDLFSYNNILAIREDNGKLIAATENGIFYYTPSSGELTKLSKANGLHEVKISAFDYNAETKTGLVGYANGTLDVIDETGILYVVDIPLATGYNGSKKINHISITGTKAVISVGYGISIFDLEKKEFGDSSFFLSGSTYVSAMESVIKDNFVYTVTSSGIISHEINVTMPIFAEWQTLIPGAIKSIDLENSTMAYSTANQVFYGDGNSFMSIGQSFSNIKDVTVNSESIIVADENTVHVFSLAGALVRSYESAEPVSTGWFSNNEIFTGTLKSGILNERSEILKPDGPYNNRSYKMYFVKDKIWVSTGGREGRFNTPSIHSDNLGFYFFDGKEWIYPSYFKSNTSVPFNVLDAVGNPSNPNETFFTNYTTTTGQGIYRMLYNDASKDFEFQKLYEWANKSRNRPVGLVFDDQNNLFASFAWTEPISQTGMGLYNRESDSFTVKALQTVSAAQKPAYYEGILWLPTPRSNDFTVVNLNGSPKNLADDKVYLLTESSGLPSGGEGSLSVAIDKTGDAWIGSDRGLRVLANATSAIENNPQLEPIIIEENGLGEELFRDTSILQIAVDSGNQKWVSTDGGGIFYLSANGEKTHLQFTRENSPLPNNSVTDIYVDDKTGKVYFATLDGIVVYQGDAVNVNEYFGDVLVYPNPVVYANYKGTVKIKGLAEKTNIRITDAAGNLVHQAVARGGYYEWDLTYKGKRVASGIYFVLMTNADGTDTATAKIGVVN